MRGQTRTVIINRDLAARKSLCAKVCCSDFATAARKNPLTQSGQRGFWRFTSRVFAFRAEMIRIAS